jgi:hypothetical protein
MPETSRRQILRAGVAAVAGAVGGASHQPSEVEAHAPLTPASRWDSEYTFGHTQLFMEEYLEGTLGILRRQRGELEHIGELTSRATSVIRAGHTVWTWMTLGHMPGAEQKETRRGSPRIMKDLRDFALVKKGDMVFTDLCRREVDAARKRGAYIVCVTTNYQDNEFRPAGFTDPSHAHPDGLFLKDVSDEILHSHTPYTQGLVHAPQVPEFAICPSSGTGSGSTHWMLNAELANKLARPAARAVDKSAEYLRILTARIERVREHLPRLREAAATMAHRIRDGGRWFARSIEHPGIQSEYHVASGVRVVNWGDWDATRNKNVFSVTAISPAHEAEVALAREKKAEGAFVIGIAPSEVDGVVPKGRLLDAADAGFDTFSPESGGVIRVDGRDDTICPTTGIVANVIQQMVVAQWCDEMVRRGSVPYFLMGIYQKGGREYNAAMQIVFERQGF